MSRDRKTPSHYDALRDGIVAEVEGRMDLDALQAVRHRESDERRQLAAALRRPSG